MSERFLRDNRADRELGALWESNFCRLAAWYGKAFHAYQEKRTGAARWSDGLRPTLLPDIQFFTAGGESHEVKHKNPTSPRKFVDRCYGLETYRLKALLHFYEVSEQSVFYTIHDWEAAGARASDQPMPNLLQDWRSARFETLGAYAQTSRSESLRTWINGTATTCEGYYWPIRLWERLDLYWGLPR